MYNNYGYNPYYQPRYNTMPQQPNVEQSIQQPQNNIPFNGVQNRSLLNGKLVDSIDVVKSMEIPLDGSISYFPLTDGSAIVSKQLQSDGTSKMVVYKPVQEDKKEEIQFATLDDIQEAINDIDLSDIQDLKDDIKEIKKQLKEFKIKKGKDE